MRTRPLRGVAHVILGASAVILSGAEHLHAQAQPRVSDYMVAGIRVIHKPVTANDVVAIRLFLRGGAAAIRPANAGIEHLMAQSVTHGTQKYSKDAFSALATSTGTEVGGATALDHTAFFVQGVKQNFNDAWDLFTQAALHPTFPEEEVAQVREQIVNDLKQRTDDPDRYLNMIADSLLYEGHPYAASVTGTPESIAKLTRDDLVRWHARRMTKANLLLVVVGNVTREELSPRIAAAFDHLPAVGGGAVAVPPLNSRPSSIAIVERPLPTNYVLGLVAAPSRAHPDYPAMQMMSRVLSERLFEEIRTKRNLTYAVSAGLSGARQSKASLYVTAVEPDTTVKVIFSEVRRIQQEPVSAKLLRETINVFVTSYWMGQETNMGQATSLGNWEITGGGWRNAAMFVDRMRAVTPADIRRVAADYWKNARFVVIGDPKKVTQTLFTTF
jgi:zinc protease